MLVHLGEMVERVFRAYEAEHAGCSVTWFAEQLHCDRRNVYDIFRRPTIDSQLLTQISLVLEYNFFDDLCRLVEAEMHKLRTQFVSNRSDLIYFVDPEGRNAMAVSYSELVDASIRTSYLILEKLVRKDIGQ